ncbi:MAG TPA: NAD-dependent succinate-semialdehyde dehydrogenase [Chloroflexota bacterium]|nr:NAD-dependent succinate-semialdehyde dehydrogenase [Chloroflexota bacterium]
MAIESINPATEEVEARFDELTPAQVEAALAAAASAYRAWSRTSFDARGALFRRAAARLRQEKARYAGLITAEMGKPIVEAEAEVEKCAWNCEFYAEHAAAFLTDERVETSAKLSYVAFEPLGVVLAVMPWNFPFWQVFRAAVPAMMAGNTCVLKHASNVPRCALAVEEIFREAGFPDGAFRTLLVSARAVDPIIADARIRAVTLTGSDVAGREVAAAAGRALKKTVLELGGSDPFIVLDDADVDAAAEMAARARFQNTGQSCIAAKRFLVLDRVAADFEERFCAATARLRVGDPRERETQVGPMARGDLRDTLEQQLRASVEQGARVLTGGTRLEGRGYYFAPTVLAEVRESMPVMQDETFGPLAAVYRVRDDDEAVQVANSSRFGLGSSVFTRDYERGQRLARRIESGLVFINGMVASDPRLPFGGVKDSGYGRELSAFGIREFVNVQTIVVNEASSTSVQVNKAVE